MPGKPRPKQNCWEFKRCGREPGGVQAIGCSACPATTDRRLDGVHGGKNAGRACWIVAGTMCGGRAQGTFAEKMDSCLECDFYQRVRKDEWPRFELLLALRKKLASPLPLRPRAPGSPRPLGTGPPRDADCLRR